MYLQLVLGIGCVVIAAATAVYLSMSSPLPPHQTHNRSRTDNDEDDDNDADYYGFKGDKTNKNRLRESRPGDKCIFCLEKMTQEMMRTMHCGHAMHELPCYAQYRQWRRQCPYCNQLVIRIDLPGEDCAICCEPMEEHNMHYLKCEHALHAACLTDYRNKFKYTTCPVCSRTL